jgi:hypothetical protein
LSATKISAWLLAVILTASGAALVWAQADASATGPMVKPGAVQKQASMAAPGNAKVAKSIGKKALKLSTANTPGDVDASWVEQIDIDGDGTVEDANLVWDDEDKVLYSYADDAFTCRNGGMGMGELLVAAYGEGNAWNRPAGSGFWLAALNRGECGAHSAGLWGCRFDADGNATACGIATLDEKSDDIVIATATK